MIHSRFKGVVSILVAGSMFVTSTGAAAATSRPMPHQVSPWVTLAGLTGGAPAAALCGAAVTAAQAPAPGCVLPVIDTPPPVAQSAPPPPIPVPPVEPVGAG